MEGPSRFSRIRFGVFEVDLQAGELRKNGLKVRLQEQPFQILVMLLARPGEVVAREELQHKLWPPETFVDFEVGLNTAIKRLRDALGDSAESPRYLETLPRRGYRFIAPVEEASTSTSSIRGIEKTGAGIAAPSSKRSRSTRIGIRVLSLAGLIGLLVAIYAGALRQRLWKKLGAVRIESIAVLPLRNISNDPEQDFFADGMTDALVTNLGKISALNVISRTSVMRYRNTQVPLPEIARELKVDALVEGTVTRSSNRVRITANLVQANPEKQLWAESYEGDLRDVLALQSQVASAIAQQVEVKLTPAEHERLSGSRSVDPEAYRLYIKGRYFWVKRNEESINRAVDYFRQAIEHDPGYAAAYSGLADCYSSLGFAFDVGSQPPRDAQPKAKAAALKALELDSSLADAHNSLAFAKLNYDWDWQGAEAEFKRCLELNPGYSHGHHWYAHFLLSSGRLNEALAESARALELDPLSPIINAHLGWHHIYTRQYDRAIEQLTKTLELDPHYGLAFWYRGLAYAQKKMYPEALRELGSARDLLPGNLVLESDIGNVYAVSGNKRAAESVIAELKQESAHRYANPYQIALIYAGLGQRDQTFEWLEKAYRGRSDLLVYFKVDPRLDPIRSDSRFAALLRRIAIPAHPN
jgi:TolB-like protein/DNA-binding winged helix-turn-helix (wHTH) protein/Tfp pilus assembly protein PilF